MQGRAFQGSGKFSSADHGLKLFRKSAKARMVGLGPATGFAEAAKAD
jgi:hypothetical protein